MTLSRRHLIAAAAALPAIGSAKASTPPKGFVTVKDGRLHLDGKPYRFAGTNVWYAAWLGAPAGYGDLGRLRRELGIPTIQAAAFQKLLDTGSI